MNRVALIAFAALLLAGCSAPGSADDKQITAVHITGSIAGPAGETVSVIEERLLDNEDAIKDSLDASGGFSLSFDVSEPAFFSFHHGAEYATIYLRPGDSLHLTVDPAQFDESLKFSGRGADINNYIASRYLLVEGMEGDWQEIYGRGEDAFVARTDSVRRALEDHLSGYLAANPAMDTGFVSLARAWMAISRAEDLLKYERYHAHVAQKDSFRVQEGFYGFIEELDINNPALLRLPSFAGFAKEYIGYRLAASGAKHDSRGEDMAARFRLVPGLFSAQATQEYVKTSLLLDYLLYDGMAGVDELIADVDSFANKEYAGAIRDEYAKWEKISPGKDAPAFTYQDMEGREVSLASLRGNYVYVDVWATWCAPCKAEQPHLEKMVDEFKGRNVVFLGVSVDESKEAWEKMVKEKGLKGTHVFAGGWDTDITKNYNISGIPRFLLIDPAGKIVDANAPRPSGNIREVLSGLDGI